MSVYVRALMPYNFVGKSDKEAAIKEINHILDQLKEHFCIKKGFELKIEEYEDSEWFDMPNDYRITTPFHDFDIVLGDGFLAIDSSWKYSQYFYNDWDDTWLRDYFYDFVSALGQEEAIIADEYNVWCGYDFTYQDWLDAFPNVPRLDFSSIDDSDLEGAYIDDFKECKKRKEALQASFPGYTILTIGHVCGPFLLAVKDGKMVLLDEYRKKPLDCGEIDDLNCNLNGAGFVIYKGNKSAFFTPEGKRLTPYRVGDFEWGWEDLKRAVWDCVSGEKIYETSI